MQQKKPEACGYKPDGAASNASLSALRAFSYAPDGRMLKIAEPDADVIRTIFDLYQQHENVRIVKQEVDRLGLRTPLRTLCSCRVKGGAQFSYGHIHYILTNPVYAGRIRHHARVYPGQHPPLIPPNTWDDIQARLGSDATKARTFTRRNRGSARPSASPLVGKFFDQTGDRLTPRHTKTAKGRRLRYYVSHRLIRGAAPRDPSGCRLPASELETQVATLIDIISIRRTAWQGKSLTHRRMRFPKSPASLPR